MPAGTAATGDTDGIRGGGLIERCHRHRLGRHRHQAKAECERGCNKHFHWLSPSSDLPRCGSFSIYANIVAVWLRKMSPAMAAPVMAMPTMPTVVPTPVPMAMPVMPPAHLFWLEMIDLVLADHSRFHIFSARRHEARLRGNRRQRRRLRSRSKGRGAGGNSKGEFQKMAAFHDFFSSGIIAKQ
jgi:hypothetical protein